MSELDEMTNQDKLNRTNRGDATWHYKLGGTTMEMWIRRIATRVSPLDEEVDVLGPDHKAVGKTTLRRKIAWLAQNFTDVVKLLKAVIKTQAVHTRELAAARADIAEVKTLVAELLEASKPVEPPKEEN